MFTHVHPHTALKTRGFCADGCVEHYPGWVTRILFYFVTSGLFYVESIAIYKRIKYYICLKTKVGVKVSVCSVHVCVSPWSAVSQEMLQIHYSSHMYFLARSF